MGALLLDVDVGALVDEVATQVLVTQLQRQDERGTARPIDLIENLQSQGTHTITLQLRKEEFYLFNDALNTFYLRLYGVRHMVMNHSNRERESSNGSFIYHGVCYTSHRALAGLRNSPNGFTMKD